MPPRPHLCAGCLNGFSPKDIKLRCRFCTSGFEDYTPCGTVYHPECFRAGEPFTTRRLRNEGLSFPKQATWPNFVCEACTVRKYLRRELFTLHDGFLLMLERVRLLDIISSWAKGTHASYKSKLNVIKQFEDLFGLTVLTPSEITTPKSGPEVPLMWCQEWYSLRQSTRKYDKNVQVPISFSTIRALRSAASQWLALDSLNSSATGSFMNSDKKVIHQDCRPTDGLSYQYFAKGMVERLGDQPRPSVALLDRHVRTFDEELEAMFLEATSDLQRRDIALAGFANLALWLGWLRSAECFGINWEDAHALEPLDSAQADLPTDCGMVDLRLNPVTKSDRARTADVLIAYNTRSGLSIGKWFRRAKRYRARPTGPIFCHINGTRWSSFFFRNTYLYPSLHRQRLNGDPLLAPFDGSSGNSIESRFWSLHCYRRGGRSHVSRGGIYGGHRLRTANETMVYEHARWRLRKHKVDKHYQEWTPRDRIKITLYCH